METEIICRKNGMILINYETPDGFKRQQVMECTCKGRIKLYEKVKDDYKMIDYIKVEDAGCEYG
ncbi:hypothetical protein [uncultured Brachyspira sp.]|uniref:hypothetical protein n=1 Tax=uncultured Brachyspira sp. TaxID=221953 RepID=UPI002609FF2F|nr:hypothetical protein [uncultured Brachyspira sp.]